MSYERNVEWLENYDARERARFGCPSREFRPAARALAAGLLGVCRGLARDYIHRHACDAEIGTRSIPVGYSERTDGHERDGHAAWYAWRWEFAIWALDQAMGA